MFIKTAVQEGKFPFDILSDEATAAEKAQSAVDKFFDDNNLVKLI